MSMEETFTSIYRSNGWGGRESLSGSGSDMVETKAIRKALPKLFKKYKVKTLLDLPCGDFNWMEHVDRSYLRLYDGADVVTELLNDNRRKWPDIGWYHIDITKTWPPEYDMILCRDLLGHFSNEDVEKALDNIIKSGSKYLLSTTFPAALSNVDIETGSWRPINLELLLGEPLELIDEDYSGKKLGLWNLKTVKRMSD